MLQMDRNEVGRPDAERAASAWQRYRALLSEQIWGTDLRSLSLPRRFLLRTARFVYVLIRDLLQGDLNLRRLQAML